MLMYELVIRCHIGVVYMYGIIIMHSISGLRLIEHVIPPTTHSRLHAGGGLKLSFQLSISESRPDLLHSFLLPLHVASFTLNARGC